VGIAGSDGGSTTLVVGGTTYTAGKGYGGAAGTSTGAAGGNGGTSTDGDTNRTGGKGGDGTASSGSGGGGSAAGTTADGNPGSMPTAGTAVSLYGGAGGAGTTANSANGTTATDLYGGGGGGGTRNGTGGSGMSGYIRITWAANASPSAPDTLYVNLRVNGASSGVDSPVAVGDGTPVFSAINRDSDEGDVADYYQLIVYSDSGCSTTQIWDSTKTSMSNCTEDTRCLTASGKGVQYGGTALRLNGGQYYWKIKFWDDGGAEGTFSSCVSFTMLGPAGQMRHGNYFFNRTTKAPFSW